RCFHDIPGCNFTDHGFEHRSGTIKYSANNRIKIGNIHHGWNQYDVLSTHLHRQILGSKGCDTYFGSSKRNSLHSLECHIGSPTSTSTYNSYYPMTTAQLSANFPGADSHDFYGLAPRTYFHQFL